MNTPFEKSLFRPPRRAAMVLVMCVLTAASAVAAAEEPAQDGRPKSISVDLTAQARFGVVLSILKAATAPTRTTSTARVLDPAQLLQLDGELVTSAATFAASRAEAQRTRKLYMQDRTASARAVEAAEVQAQADLQKVNAARRQLALEWGGGIANMQAHERAELVKELTNSRAELVRVEIPTGMPLPKTGSNLEVRGDSASEDFSGVVLGMLPVVDPRLQTRGVLVELKGDAARLPIGQMLSAQVPTADSNAIAGVVLPRAALLRRDGRVWSYVQTAPTTFIRREVRNYHPVPSGWFVPGGFTPGEHVVTAGAGALLGVERPAAADTD